MTNPPFRVDPVVERRVQERLREYKLAMALARQSGAKPPSDNLGFISPYRAQAMARIAENTLGPGERMIFDPSATVRQSPTQVGADTPRALIDGEREYWDDREDTDRARVNAYSLMEALKALQEQESAKKRGTPRWR